MIAGRARWMKRTIPIKANSQAQQAECGGVSWGIPARIPHGYDARFSFRSPPNSIIHIQLRSQSRCFSTFWHSLVHSLLAGC